MLDYTALTVALFAFLSAIASGFLSWSNGRKQATTDANSKMIDNALRIVDEYQEIAKDAQARVKALQAEFDEYKQRINAKHKEYDEEFDSAARKIDELSVTNLKYRLILSIYLHQLRINHLDPLIYPEQWDSVTIEELRQTAEALGNIEKRRNVTN